MRKIFTKLIYSFLVITHMACGSFHSSNEKNPESSETQTDLLPIEFSGFIQRAFPISVEGIQFSDSEHFYTNFIDELILSNPEYSDSLADAIISVEGEYSLNRFGSFADVFMSTEQREGHIYQSKTDRDAKFSIEVMPESIDETFKARVVTRIGLLIEFPDQKTHHYCYIIHSIIEGLKVNEYSKPIIFDEFHTQLNTYQCKERKGLEIDLDFPSSREKVEEAYEIGPHVIIEEFSQIDHQIKNIEGSLSLAQTTLAADKMLLVSNKVRDLNDGSIFYPMVLIDEDGKIETGRFTSKEAQNTRNNFCYWFPVNKGLLTKHCKHISKRKFLYFEENSTPIELDKARFDDQKSLVFYQNSLIYQFHPTRDLCRIDIEFSPIHSVCTNVPESNPNIEFRSCSASVKRIDCLVVNQAETSIYTYNMAGTFQSKYQLSKLAFSTHDLENIQTVSDGLNFYFSSINDNNINLYKYILVK